MMWTFGIALSLGAASALILRVPAFLILVAVMTLAMLGLVGIADAAVLCVSLQIGYGLGILSRAVTSSFFDAAPDRPHSGGSSHIRLSRRGS